MEKKYSIYKISSQLFGDKIYIGSTSLKLNKRFNLHKSNYKRYLCGLCNFVMSFEIIKLDDAKIELIEQVSKDNILDREKHYIKSLNCINKYVPNRKSQEYYQDKKNDILKRMKQYYLDNKEIIKQKKRDYYNNNKEMISIKRKQKKEINKLSI